MLLRVFVSNDNCNKSVCARAAQAGVSAQIDENVFRARFRQRFYDPAFDGSTAQIDALADIAWEAYHEGRKAPRTRAAGPEFENPEYQLSEQWLQTRDEIRKAQRLHEDAKGPARILLISGAARHEQTCPGEVSKSYRLCQEAEQTLVAERAIVDLLDLSSSDGGVRSRHLPVQGLCVDGDAAVSLALLVLSQPFARPGERLDGRNLSALGRGAWRDDRRRRCIGIRRRHR